MATQTQTTTSPFKFETERKGELVVIHCHGKLVAGVTDVFYKQVKDLMVGSRQVVLDLSNLTHMDSMGVGTCVRLYVSAKSAGSSLQLVNIGPRIRQILGITNLLSVLCDMCEKGVSVRF
jgi:anti-sigma B factor antagonist